MKFPVRYSLQVVIKILIIVELCGQCLGQHYQIPLSYALSHDLLTKYPIQLSFTSCQTFSPQQSDILYLYEANISLQVQKSFSQENKVIIGLKQPSQFLYAISQYYKVEQNAIEFGKDQYLKLIVNDLSFIQSQDLFSLNQRTPTQLDVQYNYGDNLKIENQKVQIIDGDTLVWNQFLIKTILNNLKDENHITWTYNQTTNTISLKGSLSNFPRITITQNSYALRIDMQKLLLAKPQLHYLPDSTPPSFPPQKRATQIGLSLLTQFSKFQIQDNTIIFKRTSKLFMLYIFLGYWVLFSLAVIVWNRNDHFRTVQFVRNVVSWVVGKDPAARVEVLRTELE